VVAAPTPFITSQNALVPMVLLAGFSSGFLLLRTESICERTNPCEQGKHSARKPPKLIILHSFKRTLKKIWYYWKNDPYTKYSDENYNRF